MMPHSSVNAPRVPEPSSRVITEIAPEAPPPQPVRLLAIMPNAATAAAIFVIFFITHNSISGHTSLCPLPIRPESCFVFIGKRGIKLVRKMRSQIFWQIVQKFRRHAVAWQGISGQSAGKYASRLRAKPSGGLYSAFPYVPMNNVIITSLCKVCYRGNVKSRLNVKFCGMSFVNSEKSTGFRYIFSQHAPKGQPFSQEIPLKRQIPAVCSL